MGVQRSAVFARDAAGGSGRSLNMSVQSDPIAIVGASSLIAVDFVLQRGKADDTDFRLYTRNPGELVRVLEAYGLARRWPVKGYESFGEVRYGAVVNFVGVGDPARAISMGREILTITRHFDELVMGYLKENPHTRYVFISSGAVYGSDFEEAVREETFSCVPINNLQPHHHYGLAKLYAEAVHRSMPELSIIDVRIFNYVSRRMNLGARYLITEMLAAIREQRPFRTTTKPVVRDYLHPTDMSALLSCAISAAPHANAAIDAYSLAPIGKEELMGLMASRFGLQVEIVRQDASLNASGRKSVYCSENRAAARFGYAPIHTSGGGIVDEVAAIIAG